MLGIFEGFESPKKRQRVEGDWSTFPVEVSPPSAALRATDMNGRGSGTLTFAQPELDARCEELMKEIKNLKKQVQYYKNKSARLAAAAGKTGFEEAKSTTPRKSAVRYDDPDFLRTCWCLWNYSHEAYDVWLRSGIVDVPTPTTLGRCARNGRFQVPNKKSAGQPVASLSQPTAAVSVALPGPTVPLPTSTLETSALPLALAAVNHPVPASAFQPFTLAASSSRPSNPLSNESSW